MYEIKPDFMDVPGYAASLGKSNGEIARSCCNQITDWVVSFFKNQKEAPSFDGEEVLSAISSHTEAPSFKGEEVLSVVSRHLFLGKSLRNSLICVSKNMYNQEKEQKHSKKIIEDMTTFWEVLAQEIGTPLPDDVAENNFEHKANFNQWLSDNSEQLGSLEYLNLESKSLSYLPPEIGKLTNLKQLHLSKNNLTTLPPEIGNLTQLTSLDLNHNDFTQFPEVIGKLTNLSSLSIEHNQLTSLSEVIGNLKELQFLELEDNKITELPDSIKELTNLNGLILNQNQLTKFPERELGYISSICLEDNPRIQLTSTFRLYKVH